MAKYPFFSLPSQYFLNILIIRGDGMENADRCVCCGNIIPEGAMVCAECLNKCRDTYKDTQDCAAILEKFFNIKLRWYQKIWLKLYEASIKIPRKGSHRYFRTKGGT